jgi:hypothetical protein
MSLERYSASTGSPGPNGRRSDNVRASVTPSSMGRSSSRDVTAPPIRPAIRGAADKSGICSTPATVGAEAGVF